MEKPVTYGAITRSEVAWNWRAAARRASFTPDELVEAIAQLIDAEGGTSTRPKPSALREVEAAD